MENNSTIKATQEICCSDIVSNRWIRAEESTLHLHHLLFVFDLILCELYYIFGSTIIFSTCGLFSSSPVPEHVSCDPNIYSVKTHLQSPLFIAILIVIL